MKIRFVMFAATYAVMFVFGLLFAGLILLGAWLGGYLGVATAVGVGTGILCYASRHRIAQSLDEKLEEIAFEHHKSSVNGRRYAPESLGEVHINDNGEMSSEAEWTPAREPVSVVASRS